MSRRGWVVAGIGLAVVAIGITTVGAIGLADDGTAPSSSGAEGDGSTAGAATTAEVTRQDLRETEEIDGTLGYQATHQVTIGRSGTLTALAEEGSTVTRGQAIVEVDDRPVPLLYGSLPLYRRLARGVDDGADVTQLEANLVALGFGIDTVTVDDHFSAATAEAVEDWQDALGLDDTGAIDVGDVVVEPGEVRIGSHLLTIGQQAGAALEVSGTGRVVTVDLPADRQGLITAGDDVQVELSDGSTVAGRVFAVGRVVTPADETDPSSSATVEVAVGIVDPTEVPDIDQAPVRVSIATTTATDVLTVPVEALIALAEGGYAVERAPGEDPPAAGATPDLLAVEVGVFAGGRVEVTGDLEAGDHVVVPAS